MISLIVLIFNAPLLFSSHEKSVSWLMPETACENDEGVCCVVDKYLTQLTVLNPDLTVRAMIAAKFSSSISPDSFANIAIDDKYIYILDMVRSQNGTSIESERILKYDFDGRYVATVYTDTETDHDFQGNIRNIMVYNGILYVLKAHGETAMVFRIDDGAAKEIIRRDFSGSPIQLVSYQPEINTMTVSTMNGKSFVFDGTTCEEVMLADTTALIANVVVMNDGSRYVLDRTNGLLVKQEADGAEHIVCHTNAIRLWHNAPSGTIRHLFLCDEGGNSVTSVSVADHKLSVTTEVTRSAKHLFRWRLTLCALVVFAIALLYYLTIVVVRLVRNRLATRDAERQMRDDGVLSPVALYGKPALFVILSFLVTGLLLSVAAYRITMDYATTTTNNIASSISSISSEALGESLKRLDAADDYGNADFKMVYGFCQALCAGNNNDGFDLLFDLIRLDGDSLYYVFDHSAMNVLGSAIPQSRLNALGLGALADSIARGQILSHKFRTSSGQGIYAVAAPIYDASHAVVGAVAVINDLDAVGEHAKEDVLTLLLRVFSLLSFIIMLFVELKLIREFMKVRSERFAAAGKKVTICEGHRELRIITRLPFYLLVPFIAPYSRQMAIASGMAGDPSMLAALPLSIYGLLMAVGNLFLSIITKKNPGRSINIASAATLVVAAIFLVNHLYFKSYYLLIVAFSLFGLMAAVNLSACKAIRLFDLKPDKRYRKLVFTNMEAPIYASIGAALGSLAYESMGFVAVIGLLALACIAAIVLSKLFVADDINITSVAKKTANGNKKVNLRYFMRIDVIGFILFVNIPASFLMQYTSFVLPMFNANLGNTILMVGFLTLMTKLLPIPISPNIIMSMKEKSVTTSGIISLTALALAFFAFALQPNMMSLALMLFVLGIFHSVLFTLVERFQIESAKASGVIPSDVNGVFATALCVGDFAGPLCLAAMMAIGDSATGIISGAFCLLCIVGLLLTSRKRGMFTNRGCCNPS